MRDKDQPNSQRPSEKELERDRNIEKLALIGKASKALVEACIANNVDVDEMLPIFTAYSKRLYKETKKM